MITSDTTKKNISRHFNWKALKCLSLWPVAEACFSLSFAKRIVINKLFSKFWYYFFAKVINVYKKIYNFSFEYGC